MNHELYADTMGHFDDEIESAVNRAGRATAGMTLAAMVILAFGIIVGVASGFAGLGIGIGAAAAAALLYGIGVIINLLGMQLMETWRQGQREE